jgi:integrase
MRLREIRTETVRHWYARVVDDSTVLQAAKAYRLLSAIMATAVADGRIVASPCTIRGAGREQSEERPFIDAEAVLALADAIDLRLRIMVLLAGFATLRRGELLALRRRDVDLLHGTVVIERQVVTIDKLGRMETPPKTFAGRRVVTLPNFVAQALKTHLDQFVGPGPDDLILAGEKGGPLATAVLYPAFRKARQTVGLPNVTLHDLRHAAGTLAAQQGATTKELMARMGHASPAAALRYQHASEKRDRELAQRLDAVIVSSRPGPKPARIRSRHPRAIKVIRPGQPQAQTESDKELSESG